MTWRLYYEKLTKDGKIEEVTESRGTHGLGFLPVYPVLDYVKSNNLKNFPVPPLRNLINMAFILFNSRSLVKNLELYNFPILSLSNFDSQQLALGVTNALNSTGDSKFPPNFIVPPSSSIEVLTKNCDGMEEKMYQYAQQHGYIAAQQQTNRAQSGIKAEWDFRGTNSVLTKTAYAAKKAYEWAAKTFAAYMNTTFTFNIDFPSEYSTVYSEKRINQCLAIVQENPPEPVAREVWKEIVTVEFEDDPDRAAKINAAIDKNYADSLKEPKPGELLPEDKGTGADDNKGQGDTNKKGITPETNNIQSSALADLLGGVIAKFKKGKRPGVPAGK